MLQDTWQQPEAFGTAPCPDMTQYRHICSFLGLDVNKIPIIKKIFIKDWELSFTFPILVNFIILSSYAVNEIVLTKIIPWLDFNVQFLMTILMLLFVISYWVGILEGPGYLPFYYPYKMHDDNEDPYELGGVVTTNEQLEFVKQQLPMHRIKFFKSARRIVIRPDHFCLWFASFIGKRNHKLFFLFNFWGFIYISLFFGFECYGLYLITQNSKLMNYMIPVIIYLFLALYFVIMTGTFTFEITWNLCRNVTQFELMQKDKVPVRYKTDFLDGWIEVFGPTDKWYLWLIPIPAFYGIDNNTLVNNYMANKML